jgi:hypothetical protein
MKNLTYLLCIAAIGLTGCASTKIENKNDFIYNSKYVQTLSDAEFMPTKKMLQRKILKGAVLPTKVLSPLAEKALVAPVIDAKITQHISDAGVTVIDRNAGIAIKDELAAYENTGRAVGHSLDVADIVIAPVIVSTTHETLYSPAFYKEKDGKYKWVSAKCLHKIEVSGYLKIYNMPSMSQRQQIELEKNISYNTETRRRDCKTQQATINDFIITTVKSAIRSKGNALKNEFSPRGYVLEYRKVEDQHYIKVNQGKKLGLKQNLKIQFIRTIEERDSLTGEVSRNEFVMGKGKVTDIIHDNSAWVEVSEGLASKVKRGDNVKVLFKTGYFQ